jgi:CRISPR type III-B/RAMP module-associated protein Cmr5
MENYLRTEILIAQDVKRELDLLVNDIEIKDEKFWNFVEGLPTMLVQNGLVQTFAFIKSKAKRDDGNYGKVYNAFQNYVKKLAKKETDTTFDMLKFLIDGTHQLEIYLYYQQQVLQFAIWFKRLGLALYAPRAACKIWR